MNRPRITSPLLICGFRPFFVLTAVSAIGFMLTWVLLLGGWLGDWHPPGGPTAWHAHELLFMPMNCCSASPLPPSPALP